VRNRNRQSGVSSLLWNIPVYIDQPEENMPLLQGLTGWIRFKLSAGSIPNLTDLKSEGGGWLHAVLPWREERRTSARVFADLPLHLEMGDAIIFLKKSFVRHYFSRSLHSAYRWDWSNRVRHPALSRVLRQRRGCKKESNAQWKQQTRHDENRVSRNLDENEWLESVRTLPPKCMTHARQIWPLFCHSLL
jgi:hypothetical protein